MSGAKVAECDKCNWSGLASECGTCSDENWPTCPKCGEHILPGGILDVGDLLEVASGYRIAGAIRSLERETAPTGRIASDGPVAVELEFDRMPVETLEKLTDALAGRRVVYLVVPEKP